MLGTIALLLLLCAIMMILLLHITGGVPVGYQDETGFHYGSPDRRD
jgi:hypothetical protein